MTRFFLLSLFLLGYSYTFSQCIDRDKITYGGDWGFTDYIHRCPTYSFAYGGDTSRNWNVLNDPIDIFQAPENILKLKKYVDKEIKEFSGEFFFQKLNLMKLRLYIQTN